MEGRGTTPVKLSFATTTSTKARASRLDELCLVSYGVANSNSTPHHRPMPAAARAAFKALERDSSIAIARSRVALTATAATAAAEASAIDTLCLVTYSDDEDASASWQQQQQQLGRVQRTLLTGQAGAAAAGKASAVFAALCSEDHTTGEGEGLPEVLETLCILSYDEEAS